MEREFVALGHAGSDAYAGLEAFPNPGVARVELVSDELTAVCPITGQPDFYTATIEYTPRVALPRVEVAQALPRPLPRPGRLLRGTRRADSRRGRRRARARSNRRPRDAAPEGARGDHDHRVCLTAGAPCGFFSSASASCSSCLRPRRAECACPRSTTRGTASRRPTAPTSTGTRTGTRRRTTSRRRTTRRDGLYSSSDRLVIAQQMDEIKAAGIDEIAVSWWGRGSPEDRRLAAVVAAARARGLAVAVHLEPYAGRTRARARWPTSPTCATYGITDVLRLRPFDFAVADWAAATERAARRRRDALRADRPSSAPQRRPDSTASTPTTSSRTAATSSARLCARRTHVHLLCAPSVGPGLRRAPRQRRSHA